MAYLYIFSYKLRYWCVCVSVKPENTKLSLDKSNTSAVLLSSTVVFNCTTFSHPPAHEYLFFHNQVLLGRNVSGFYHLQISNSGVYSCTPVNSAGVGESAAVSLTVVGRFAKNFYVCHWLISLSLHLST